jgi:hypothetical protein
MKRSGIFLLVALLLSGAVLAQNSKEEILTNKSWKIKSDEMSGIGIHHSLPGDTQISFSEDGSWQSTSPLQNAKQGKWRLENEGKKLVLITEEEVQYLILDLSGSELSFRLKKNAATNTLTWASNNQIIT